MKPYSAVVAAIVLVVHTVSTTARGADAVEFLFVRTASGATRNGTLTTTGVGQDTTEFRRQNRPYCEENCNGGVLHARRANGKLQRSVACSPCVNSWLVENVLWF